MTMNRKELMAQAKVLGIKGYSRLSNDALSEAIAKANAAVLPPVVERKASRKGRKALAKPGMLALVNAWDKFGVGETRILPDFEGDGENHADLTLARYHFREKAAKSANLKAGVDYTIEGHPEHGATITRLR